jgi:hypothetical protein
MADTSLFGRLKKLFTGQIIIRNVGGNKLKVVDYDETQAVATNLRDRFLRMTTSATQYNYENYIAYQQVRQELFRDYDAMDNDPIVASVLDIYSDECTTRNEYGKVLTIKSQDDQVKDILENLFYDILNIDFNLWPWIRNLCKYGDFFLVLEIAPELGIVSVQPVSTYEMNRVEEYDKDHLQKVKFIQTPITVRSTYTAGQKIEYENYEVAHFRHLADTNWLPYGKSILEGARRVWKQLTMMEDAMLIHRITRAPAKRKFKIDIGNIPPHEVENYMKRIISQSKKQPYINETTGDYNLKYNIQNIMEDFYFPVRGSDSGTDVENLEGLEYVAIDDINYLKNKFMAALKVPKAFLGYEENVSGKATLAAEDVRFARTIDRLQKIVISELYKIAITHLYAQNITDDRLVNFDLELTNPSTIAEQEKINLWSNKVNLARDMQDNKIVSTDWIYKNVFHFTNDECEDLRNQLIEDAKERFRLTQIETAGQDPKAEAEQQKTDVNGELGKFKGEDEQQGDDTGVDEDEKIKELENDLGVSEANKPAGRPKSANRYEKDDSKFGRDPLGKKENQKVFESEFRKKLIKQLKDQYNPKHIILEGKNMMDENNIFEI